MFPWHLISVKRQIVVILVKTTLLPEAEVVYTIPSGAEYNEMPRSRTRLQWMLLCVALVTGTILRLNAGTPILVLPAKVIEGAGTLTNGGQVKFATSTTADTLVALQSSDPASLIV